MTLCEAGFSSRFLLQPSLTVGFELLKVTMSSWNQVFFFAWICSFSWPPECQGLLSPLQTSEAGSDTFDTTTQTFNWRARNHWVSAD